MFDSRSPDSVTRFVRNDDWWNGEVYLDAVEFVPVPDADTRAELLLEGDLNALQTSDPGAILKLDEDPSIQQVKDETGEESFVMINSGVGAVRRHPCPRGAHARHPGGELPQPDRARRVAPGDAAVHPGEPVLQPGRHHGDGRPGGREGALRRVLRRVPGELLRRQDQHGAPVSRRLRRARPDGRSPDPGLGRVVQRDRPDDSRRTSTSRKPRSVSTTSCCGVSSAPRIRRSTTCGSCAAPSAASRSTGRSSATEHVTSCCSQAQATDGRGRAGRAVQAGRADDPRRLPVHLPRRTRSGRTRSPRTCTASATACRPRTCRCVACRNGRNWFSSIWMSE